MQNATIFEIHHKEHRQWLSKVEFYQDQIMIFQRELSVVLHQHPNLFSIIEHVDEYSSILIKKFKKLDQIRKQIILHDRQLVKGEDKRDIKVWDHNEVRDQLSTFEDNYETLRASFRRFVAKHV